MTNLLFNLVKLSDYPFIYSILGLLISINGHNIIEYVNDPILIGSLVTLVGVFATTLAITDPFGHLIKFRLKIKFRNNTQAIDEEIHNQINHLGKKIGGDIITDLLIFHSQSERRKSLKTLITEKFIGLENISTYSQLLK